MKTQSTASTLSRRKIGYALASSFLRLNLGFAGLSFRGARVGGDDLIGGDEGESVALGDGDEDAVKGITVDEGEVSGGTEEAGRERDLGEVIPPAEPPSNQASGGCGK